MVVRHITKRSFLFHFGFDFCEMYDVFTLPFRKLKGRGILAVLTSVISTFTSASGLCWWKLFLVIEGMDVLDLKIKYYFHLFFIAKMDAMRAKHVYLPLTKLLLPKLSKKHGKLIYFLERLQIV